MAVVHNFPSTSWLEATDGTSNSSFSQSPAQAPSAQASTWHPNEEDQLGQKEKYGTTCETGYKMEHNTQVRTVAAHTLWGITGKEQLKRTMRDDWII